MRRYDVTGIGETLKRAFCANYSGSGVALSLDFRL